jgi:hypothetical protein
MPLSPLRRSLGFALLPVTLFGTLALLLIIDLFLVELTKRRFDRH